MIFEVHGDIEVAGTFLVGHLYASFDTICGLFGDPTGGPSSDNKVDAEWRVRFKDGTVATISNHKNGKAYLGPEGLDAEDITHWHIGGQSSGAATRIHEAVREYLAALEDPPPCDCLPNSYDCTCDDGLVSEDDEAHADLQDQIDDLCARLDVITNMLNGIRDALN